MAKITGYRGSKFFDFVCSPSTEAGKTCLAREWVTDVLGIILFSFSFTN